MPQPDPSPDLLADRAIEEVTAAFAELKRFAADYDDATIIAATHVVHESGRASIAGASDDETWIRHAAMSLLVGLQATSGEDADDTDDSGEAAAGAEDDEALQRIEDAWRQLAGGELVLAESLAIAALEHASRRAAEDVGDVVHNGHVVLGHVRLQRGDEAAADAHLLAAADVAPSPVLASFGPNMSLAAALLRRGRSEAVLAYFERCGSFWGPLARWRADVRAGVMPDFGPNLIYGAPEDVHDPIRSWSSPL